MELLYDNDLISHIRDRLSRFGSFALKTPALLLRICELDRGHSYIGVIMDISSSGKRKGNSAIGHENGKCNNTVTRM